MNTDKKPTPEEDRARTDAIRAAGLVWQDWRERFTKTPIRPEDVPKKVHELYIAMGQAIKHSPTAEAVLGQISYKLAEVQGIKAFINSTVPVIAECRHKKQDHEPCGWVGMTRVSAAEYVRGGTNLECPECGGMIGVDNIRMMATAVREGGEDAR